MAADLDEARMGQLAHEMVRNIRNYKLVFADFGITEEDYYEIAKNDYYKKIKEQLALEWNSTSSSVERIKLESLAYYEQLMPALTKRALEPTTPLMAANDTAKLLAKTGGIGEAKVNAASAAERFVITINLGADVEGKPVIEHYDKAIEPGLEDASGVHAILNPPNKA